MLQSHQVERYARHILLPQVGGAGQARLLAAKVLVVGAGGLGAPLIQYLAAAGIGRLVIADGDRVELSNLQRQVLHHSDEVGQLKAETAAARVRAINPDVGVEPVSAFVGADTVAGLVDGCDVVADATDSFEARFLLNDACVAARVPLVSAALLRFEGQVSTWRGWEPDQPCYRCLYPSPPPDGMVPSCADAGVFGALAGLLGSLQAVEVLKTVLGIGDSLAGRLLLVDALAMTVDTVAVAADPACPVCAAAA